MIDKVASCMRCGLNWRPRLESPRVCPKCHSYRWREPFAKHDHVINTKNSVVPVAAPCSCVRCKHEWVTRKSGRPTYCPHCHTVLWDKAPVFELLNDRITRRYESVRQALESSGGSYRKTAEILGCSYSRVRDIVVDYKSIQEVKGSNVSA